jgi:hypothetical protein
VDKPLAVSQAKIYKLKVTMYMYLNFSVLDPVFEVIHSLDGHGTFR